MESDIFQKGDRLFASCSGEFYGEILGYGRDENNEPTIDITVFHPHFKRGKSEGKGIWRGNCEKFDTPTMAYAICCTGHECFEHRLKDVDCRTV